MQTKLNLYKTILLIDDDEDDCNIFQEAIADIADDLVVNSVNSSDNLLIVLENTRPSIIFIDFYLPKHNGLDCLKQIRSTADFENIPVIMWSGSCDSGNKTLAYKQGVQYYLEKPYCYSVFIDELKSILYCNPIIDKPVYGAANSEPQYLGSKCVK